MGAAGVSRPKKQPAATRKTLAADVQRGLGRLVARQAEIEAAPLDVVLAELGRVVQTFSVTTAPIFDGLPVWAGRGFDHEGRTWCYQIEYEINRTGRPAFRCVGLAAEPFLTLHAAAVWALMGALAWAGAGEEAADAAV